MQVLLAPQWLCINDLQNVTETQRRKQAEKRLLLPRGVSARVTNTACSHFNISEVSHRGFLQADRSKTALHYTLGKITF